MAPRRWEPCPCTCVNGYADYRLRHSSYHDAPPVAGTGTLHGLLLSWALLPGARSGTATSTEGRRPLHVWPTPVAMEEPDMHSKGGGGFSLVRKGSYGAGHACSPGAQVESWFDLRQGTKRERGPSERTLLSDVRGNDGPGWRHANDRASENRTLGSWHPSALLGGGYGLSQGGGTGGPTSYEAQTEMLPSLPWGGRW